MAEAGQFPADHLTLAHDIVLEKNWKTYENLFSKRRPGSHVILDNSVVELGKAVDLKMVVEAAKIIKPSCVVLPDAYLDAEQTIENCKEALGTWPEAFRGLSIAGEGPMPLMFLPQGRSRNDFLRCAQEFKDTPAIQWWGVPRNVVEYHGTRRWAIEVCHYLNAHRKIHMFGFSDNLMDDIISGCGTGAVWSIDSAVPVRCDYAKVRFLPTTVMPPRGDWWEKGQYTPQVQQDYLTARRVFQGAGWLS
jgi:hypothetical protein